MLGSLCLEQEKRSSTVPRANFSTCYVCDPARNTTSHPARLPLPHLLKLRYKFLGYYCWYRFVVTARGRRLTLLLSFVRYGFSMQQNVTCSIRLRSSFASCVVGRGNCCEHVALWHCRAAMLHHTPLVLHITAVRSCSTSCAHGLRSCWKSTKRSMQRFVLHTHPVSGWLSPFLQSLLVFCWMC